MTSGLQVSALSLGTASIGKLSRKDAATVFGRAFEVGINHIDTAESYLSGQAEIATGELIRDLGLKREKLVLGTNVSPMAGAIPRQARTN